MCSSGLIGMVGSALCHMLFLELILECLCGSGTGESVCSFIHPSIHHALQELKNAEETPDKQNTGGAISSSSPTEHLNSEHRLSLHSVVMELPGLRGSFASPTQVLRHGTVSIIGCSFRCGLFPRGHDQMKKINV